MIYKANGGLNQQRVAVRDVFSGEVEVSGTGSRVFDACRRVARHKLRMICNGLAVARLRWRSQAWTDWSIQHMQAYSVHGKMTPGDRSAVTCFGNQAATSGLQGYVKFEVWSPDRYDFFRSRNYKNNRRSPLNRCRNLQGTVLFCRYHSVNCESRSIIINANSKSRFVCTRMKSLKLESVTSMEGMRIAPDLQKSTWAEHGTLSFNKPQSRYIQSKFTFYSFRFNRWIRFLKDKYCISRMRRSSGLSVLLIWRLCLKMAKWRMQWHNWKGGKMI